VKRKRHGPDEIIRKLRDAETLAWAWKEDYNRHRPHSALGYPAFVAEATSAE
jgi:transposase InsO family protein